MMRRIFIGTALITLTLCSMTPRVDAIPLKGGPSIATFEGTLIDLRDGWGEARACTSDGATTACFRTERELDDYLGVVDEIAQSIPGGLSIQAICSSALRLYSGTSFGGSVLSLSTRGILFNLSNWGFDNVTSSYKVGACNSTFYDGANAGAPIYPGSTTAGTWASTMVAGWDNRVSSVIVS